jgi:DNA-directed RNA polymerase subunit K/omega
VEIPENISDPIDIALIEIRENVLPITIRRTLPDGTHQDVSLFNLLEMRRF